MWRCWSCEALPSVDAAREQIAKEMQERFNKGLRGLLDRVTGKYRQLKEQNELEAFQTGKRDREEKDKLRFQHLEQRRSLHARSGRLQAFKENQE